MEQSDKSGAFSSLIPDLSEDNSLSSSDSDGSSQLVASFRLPHDMILEVAQYLDAETMKSARLVSTAWHEGLENEFRRRLMIVAEFDSQKTVLEYVKIFCRNSSLTNADSKLITSSIWIKEPSDLNPHLMTKYGEQLTTLKLGESVGDSKFDESRCVGEEIFSPESIKSILTNYCPNLKVLKIFTPSSNVYCPIEFVNPDPKDVKVALDYLEIGNEENQFLDSMDWTAMFILNILKCIKSLKSVKIVGVQEDHYIEDSDDHTAVNYAKQVFEKIEELHLLYVNLDPRRLINFEPPGVRFTRLQKLQIGFWCDYCDDEPHLEFMKYLPDLLTSVKNNLKELIFYQCSVGNQPRRFVCPEIKKCILSSMSKLETFKILGIMEWDEPNLDFLENFPALKQLEITLDAEFENYYSDAENEEETYRDIRMVQNMFNVNKSKKQIVNQNLEQLTFRCSTRFSNDLKNIEFYCSNLKKLEMDFCGTPLFSGFGIFKKLKDLTIHLLEPFESLGVDDLKELSGSGIEKLCLVRDQDKSKLPINLGFIVDGGLASESLRKLELKGMEIRRKDYESAMEKLQTVQLRLWLIDCEIKDD